MRARDVILALLVSFALLALGVLTMVSMFVVNVGITNDSNEPIEVVPVGRLAASSSVARPPLYLAQFIIAIPGAPASYEVASGATSSFLYDFDDVNLCWLLVRGASSRWKLVPSRLSETKACALEREASGPCCAALAPDYVFHVEPLTELPDAPPWLSCVADDSC